VIDTATNTVGNTVPLAAGTSPFGVAITPDGKHAYVTGFQANNVSVIATATNTVVATAPVGTNPFGVGIVPPPVVVPFVAFSAQLQIAFGSAFALESSFTLSSTAPGINPVTEPVTLRVGTFTITIPPGSFKHIGGSFNFAGFINGVPCRRGSRRRAPCDTRSRPKGRERT
jgi:YVTN family beta-propeller protein